MVLNGPEGAIDAAQSECAGEVVAHIKESVKEKDTNHRDVVKKNKSTCRKWFTIYKLNVENASQEVGMCSTGGGSRGMYITFASA